MSMRHAQDELVWIDKKGVAHPLGELAAERLRAREGAFRMLPTPDHVVFMRYTGHDGRRDAEDGAVVRLAGEITAPAALCDIIAMLAQSNWVGELHVRSEDTVRRVFIEAGKVVGAITNVEEEHIGKILYRFGAIDQLVYNEVLARAGTVGQRFGEAAIEMGILTSEEVYSYLRKQIEIITLATLKVADGMYCFLEGFEESEIPFRHSENLGALLMDGVTQMDEMRYFKQRIPSVDYVPERVADRGEPNESLRDLWSMIDGHYSIVELSRVLGSSEFDATKKVFQLLQSGHARMLPPRTRGGPLEVIETANEVLKQIHQAVDTVGKGTALRTALENFADEVYELMFREAGPYENGSFEAKAVLDNVSVIVSGGNVEKFLKEMLYDYVSFALFTGGSLARRDRENSLSKQVDSLMSKLRPIG